jgi:hypothetical protein
MVGAEFTTVDVFDDEDLRTEVKRYAYDLLVGNC